MDEDMPKEMVEKLTTENKWLTEKVALLLNEIDLLKDKDVISIAEQFYDAFNSSALDEPIKKLKFLDALSSAIYNYRNQTAFGGKTLYGDLKETPYYDMMMNMKHAVDSEIECEKKNITEKFKERFSAMMCEILVLKASKGTLSIKETLNQFYE